MRTNLRVEGRGVAVITKAGRVERLLAVMSLR